MILEFKLLVEGLITKTVVGAVLLTGCLSRKTFISERSETCSFRV